MALDDIGWPMQSMESVLAPPIGVPVPSEIDIPIQTEVAFVDAGTHKEPFFSRVGNIAVAAKQDVVQSDHEVVTAATGVGVAGIQVLSRFQASWVFVPEVAVHVFKETQSPAAAAAAGGAAFLGWCLATGGLTAEGLSKYPRALNEFNESFPAFVDFFNDSLPGLEKTEPDSDSRLDRAKFIGKSMLTHIKRGFTVTGLGTAAYAGTASAKGRSRKDVHVLNLLASADGGAATGLLIYGLARVVEKVAETNPSLADRIVSDATDVKLWLGVAGLFMIESNVEHRIKKFRKNRAKSKQSELVTEE